MASTLPSPADCCTPCCVSTAPDVPPDDTIGLAVGTTIELRELPGPFINFQLKRKLGDVTYDDGYGIDYYYDANSFLVDNGVTVVKPNDLDVSEPGRWRSSIG